MKLSLLDHLIYAKCYNSIQTMAALPKYQQKAATLTPCKLNTEDIMIKR